jgi:hypothetical protein
MKKKDRGAQLLSPAVAARIGVKPGTWRKYQSIAKKEREAGRDRKNLAPEADGHHDARTPFWYEATIDRWTEDRTGPGARTDIHGGKA